MGRFSVPPNAGSTRLCLDPWAKAFIRADGSVCLCCNAPAVGNLKDESLEDILEGEETKRYRLALLNGSPLPSCQTCPDRKSVEVSELIEAVNEFLDKNKMEVY